MRALGIDPGTLRTGWGIIEPRGTRFISVAYGVIRANAKHVLERRLQTLFEGLSDMIATYEPTVVAVEDVFFAKYPNAALKLGHARGVALLVAANAGLEVSAYPPALVKRTVTGRGRAGKEQVGRLVKVILGLKESPREDAADALAIAITHVQAFQGIRTAGQRKQIETSVDRV